MNLRVIWSGLGVLGLLGLVGWGLCHPHLVTGRGGTCLPVPTRLDIPPPGYIPLVVVTGGGDAGSCRVELESNAVHDMAQDLTTCVEGQITTGIDADWYRLSACEGPIDLELVLESDGAGSEYGPRSVSVRGSAGYSPGGV